MALPQAVTIHGVADADAALRTGRPVLLLSAPGAALYAGCGWWRAVIAAALEATDRCADSSALDAIDCADAPGRALEALATGCRLLILAPCPAWDSVAERALAQRAAILADRPASLDLADPRALRRLHAWLDAE